MLKDIELRVEAIGDNALDYICGELKDPITTTNRIVAVGKVGAIEFLAGEMKNAIAYCNLDDTELLDTINFCASRILELFLKIDSNILDRDLEYLNENIKGLDIEIKDFKKVVNNSVE